MMNQTTTLVTPAEHRRRCEQESIDYNEVCVIAHRWAQSASRGSRTTRSALVRCDLIVRDDGSVVLLDGMMAYDSVNLAARHIRGAGWQNTKWDEYVRRVTLLTPQTV